MARSCRRRRPPRRSASHLVRKATERIQAGAGKAAAALINATVAVPPQQRTTAGARRGSDVPDPALAQIEATIRAVDHGLSKLGHLLDDCPACGDGEQGHNDRWAVTLATLTGEWWTWTVDHCVGVSATSPKAVEAAATAARAHGRGAELLLERWMQARRDGAEPDWLDSTASAADRLSRQVQGLADSLGQWRPGPIVRRCACGCGAHAPVGRRLTEACEKRKQRAG